MAVPTGQQALGQCLFIVLTVLADQLFLSPPELNSIAKNSVEITAVTRHCLPLDVLPIVLQLAGYVAELCNASILSLFIC